MARSSKRTTLKLIETVWIALSAQTSGEGAILPRHSRAKSNAGAVVRHEVDWSRIEPSPKGTVMDWEDLKPRPKRDCIVGEKLDGMSVSELQERIAALRIEIERTEAELGAKQKHEAAAKSLFKS